MEWWMIIRAAVTRINFKKSTQISLKTVCKFYANQHNHWCYGPEIFSRHYVTIKKLTVWKICESDQNWQNSEQSFE